MSHKDIPWMRKSLTIALHDLSYFFFYFRVSGSAEKFPNDLICQPKEGEWVHARAVKNWPEWDLDPVPSDLFHRLSDKARTNSHSIRDLIPRHRSN